MYAPPSKGKTKGDDTRLPPAGVLAKRGIRIEAQPQEPGDPNRGLEVVTKGDYIGCGVPFDLYSNRMFSAVATPLVEDDAPLPGRTGDGADLPYHMSVFTSTRGVKAVGQNCLSCHTERFNGKLVVGLGNVTIDWTIDRRAGYWGGLAAKELARWFEIGTDRVGVTTPSPAADEVGELLRRVEDIGHAFLLPRRGVNPAQGINYALFNHRADDLTWQSEPRFRLANPMVPQRTPPWWWMRYKNAMNYTATAQGDLRGHMMLVSALCVDTEEHFRQVHDDFKHFVAWIKNMEPPRYADMGLEPPGPCNPGDERCASDGKVLFEQHCAPCHGIYADNYDLSKDWYPNLLFPVSDVETDPAAAEMWTKIPEFMEFHKETYYGTIGNADYATEHFGGNVGYFAPPLRATFMNRSHFHNGCSPSVELVLNSKKRPECWRRVDYDSTNFDDQTLGWPYEEVACSDDPEVYNTNEYGYSCDGHRFGDALTDRERGSILEYLKTI